MWNGDTSLSLRMELEAPEPLDNAGAAVNSGCPPVVATGCNTNVRRKRIPKGYSTKVLNGLLQSKFICVLCENILRDPIQSQCGHRYCRDCYNSFVESKPGVKCGACIKEGDGDEEFASLTLDGIHPDHAIRKDMSSIKAECENQGCDWVGTFANFLLHENGCLFQKKKCDCDMMVIINTMEDHKKNECSLRSIECMHCSQSILAKDQAEHEMSCEFYPEICKGCGEKIPRNKMGEHVDPIKGNCENRKCPFGCDIQNTPSHQVDNVVDHLNVVLTKVMTVQSSIEQGPAPLLTSSYDVIEQRIGEMEGKVADLGQQAQALEGAASCNFVLQGEASVRPGDNISLLTITEKQSTTESVVAVLNRQLEKIIVEFNGMEHQRRLQDDCIDTLQRKVTSLQRTMALKEIALAEQDLRIQALEQTSFDGVLVWPITDFSRRRQEATSGRTLSIYSPPFYTSRNGYKMCCRLYLNGDGMGKATHLSLFFVVMKGQFDAILPWPFRQKVTLMLLDQGNTNHIIDAFRPDPTSTSFRRPMSDMNIASGCPLFCPLTTLEERKPAFVKDDSIFIKVIVDQGGM